MLATDLTKLMDKVFSEEIMALREAGQKEYAGDGRDAFHNFNEIAIQLGLEPIDVLWVYAYKHVQGILNYIKGHESQREDVRGRINDLIVYLFLLRAMIDEGQH